MSINYFHSFGMTENYYVYVEQPMYINILKILTKKLTGSAVDTAIDFYDNINVRSRPLYQKYILANTDLLPIVSLYGGQS